MKRIRQLSLVLVSTGLILACNIGSAVVPPATPLPAASDTPALPTAEASAASPSATAASTSAPGTSSLPVSYNDINLVIPQGLASGTTNSTGTDVEFPYVNPSNGDMPVHTRVVLTGYAVQGNDLAPQIHVFKAAEYAQYSDLTQQIISTLQGLQYLDGQPVPSGLPSGPFSVHGAAVSFANGHGVRYLTDFDPSAGQISNHGLIYYFHGLTSDGSKYVQVILPVQSTILAADADPNSPVPAGGIPFTMNDIPTYINNVGAKLNATPPDQFDPTLSTLDTLVQSISVQ